MKRFALALLPLAFSTPANLPAASPQPTPSQTGEWREEQRARTLTALARAQAEWNAEQVCSECHGKQTAAACPAVAAEAETAKAPGGG